MKNSNINRNQFSEQNSVVCTPSEPRSCDFLRSNLKRSAFFWANGLALNLLTASPSFLLREIISLIIKIVSRQYAFIREVILDGIPGSFSIIWVNDQSISDVNVLLSFVLAIAKQHDSSSIY